MALLFPVNINAPTVNSRIRSFYNKLNQVIHRVDYANTEFYSRRQKGVG